MNLECLKPIKYQHDILWELEKLTNCQAKSKSKVAVINTQQWLTN